MPIDSLSSGASPWAAAAQEHGLFRALEHADLAGVRVALTQGGALPAAFVQAGVNLDAADAQGSHALMFAADKLARGAVGYVAAHMSPHRFNDVHEQGHSALFFAAQRNLEMVRLLLEFGLKADVSAPDGMTSAQRAWNSGLPEVTHLLQAAMSAQCWPIMRPSSWNGSSRPTPILNTQRRPATSGWGRKIDVVFGERRRCGAQALDLRSLTCSAMHHLE